MKINELKIGDKIKFKLDQDVHVTTIVEITESKILTTHLGRWLRGGEFWIRHDQVICKLESVPDKEIPIEFPAPPFEFMFQPQEASVRNNIDEYGNYYYPLKPRIINTFTEVKGINNKSEPVSLLIPYSLIFKSNTNYKVTIEEIP